jgi:TolB protein
MSRSPDGRLVTFWTIGGGHSHLYVIGVDGQHRRELASGLSLGWSDAIDTWSSDSRFLATEVILGRLARIVVVDVDTGAARVVTPTGLAAHDPLWSPDDRWIAFDAVSGLVRSLAMIRTDGSEMRTLSHQGGRDNRGHVGGPDTWSPDGKWIYFDDSGAVYRVNVVGDSTQRLTGDEIGAYAPASSPDGTHIAFIVDHNGQYWDLYAANSDGTNAHKLLDHAEHDGWSADSRYILAQWNPTDQPGQFGGLAVIRPDGSEFRVVFPFDAACPQTLPGQRCIDGVGWGQARP